MRPHPRSLPLIIVVIIHLHHRSHPAPVDPVAGAGGWDHHQPIIIIVVGHHDLRALVESS